MTDKVGDLAEIAEIGEFILLEEFVDITVSTALQLLWGTRSQTTYDKITYFQTRPSGWGGKPSASISTFNSLRHKTISWKPVACEGHFSSERVMQMSSGYLIIPYNIVLLNTRNNMHGEFGLLRGTVLDSWRTTISRQWSVEDDQPLARNFNACSNKDTAFKYMPWMIPHPCNKQHLPGKSSRWRQPSTASYQQSDWLFWVSCVSWMGGYSEVLQMSQH